MKDFSLNHNERVKKKKDFEKVYNSAKILFSSDLLIKALYTIDSDKHFLGVKIVPAISKKAGKAVWRNRVKRLIKESYRLNKRALYKKTLEKQIGVLIVFCPNKLSESKNKKVYLKDIYKNVIELINKIEQQI